MEKTGRQPFVKDASMTLLFYSNPNAKVENEKIAKFYDETPQEEKNKWADIVKYKEEDNMPDYAILVHSLKSDCKYLGFMTLADVAYQHELKSKENDSAFVNENFAELEENYKKVLEIVKEYSSHIN